MNEKVRKTVRRLLPVFKALDAWGSTVAEKASCKKGCNHCCHNMVHATLAEGTIIAAHLLEKGLLEKYRPALEATSRLADSVGEGEESSFKYLSTKTPCAFLQNGECSIYDIRPAACRTYYVVTHPSQCSPNRPGAEIAFIDARPPMSIFVSELSKASGPNVPEFIGPFPSVILAGIELLQRSAGSFKRWTQRSPLFTPNSETK